MMKKSECIHLERRVVRRKSAAPVYKGVPLDQRPDLILNICKFPLESLSGIQCLPFATLKPCPHGGPYGIN